MLSEYVNLDTDDSTADGSDDRFSLHNATWSTQINPTFSHINLTEKYTCY